MLKISNKLIYYFLLLISCQGQPYKTSVENELNQGRELSEITLKSFIKAYTKLKNETLEMLKTMNKQNDLSGNAQFTQFEQIIKENGFSSVSEFEKINLKIAHLFKLAQEVRANASIQMKKEIRYRNEISMLEKLLQDPILSESAKKEIKETITVLRNFQSENSAKKPVQNRNFEEDLIDNYNKNNKLKITKTELELIASFEQELAETFQGMKIPAYSK